MNGYKICYIVFKAFVIILLSCEKSNDAGNGSILVTVKNQGVAVADAAVVIGPGFDKNYNEITVDAR
jgi:hypothetical protein